MAPPVAYGLHIGGSMATLCEQLRQRAGNILVEMQAITTNEPWLSLPPENRLDAIPQLLDGVLAATVCGPGTAAVYEAHIHAAVEHGRHRRSQGFEKELLFKEIHLLRRALWSYLRELPDLAPDEAVQAIMRVDIALTDCTRASLAGYFEEEYAAMGRWPQVVGEIIAQSPVRTAGPAPV